jgi:hypothetical protein
MTAANDREQERGERLLERLGGTRDRGRIGVSRTSSASRWAVLTASPSGLPGFARIVIARCRSAVVTLIPALL